MYGLERLLTELRELNYEVEDVAAGGQRFAVLRQFEISCGRFSGRIIDLGIAAPVDFPLSVASSINVRTEPQLLETTDTVAGVRNIIASPLGPDWRYWSHNFNWLGQQRGARRLMSQINGIFDRA